MNERDLKGFKLPRYVAPEPSKLPKAALTRAERIAKDERISLDELTAVDFARVTRARFEAIVHTFCLQHSERACTFGRDKGWLSTACVELLALDMFLADASPPNTRLIRAYILAGCEVQFKGE